MDFPILQLTVWFIIWNNGHSRSDNNALLTHIYLAKGFIKLQESPMHTGNDSIFT